LETLSILEKLPQKIHTRKLLRVFLSPIQLCEVEIYFCFSLCFVFFMFVDLCLCNYYGLNDFGRGETLLQRVPKVEASGCQQGSACSSQGGGTVTDDSDWREPSSYESVEKGTTREGT